MLDTYLNIRICRPHQGVHFSLVGSNVRIESSAQSQKAFCKIVLLLADRIQSVQSLCNGRLTFHRQLQQYPPHFGHIAIISPQRFRIPIFALDHLIVLLDPFGGHRRAQIHGHDFAHLLVQVLDVATRFRSAPVVMLDMGVRHVLDQRHLVVLCIVQPLIKHDVGAVQQVLDEALVACQQIGFGAVVALEGADAVFHLGLVLVAHRFRQLLENVFSEALVTQLQLVTQQLSSPFEWSIKSKFDFDMQSN